MIVRARTEIKEDLLLELLAEGARGVPAPTSCFFVNSGSSALRLFLKVLGPGKRVGVQVYTCPTVLESIIAEGCTAVFLDVNPDYYTTTIRIVEERIEEMDVLLLTHLFGIPNPDYLSIKELCQRHDVVLVDDLCQTFHSKVGGAYLEDLSDNYIYSFFYDKPISCISGGMLKVSDHYLDTAKTLYDRLPKDKDKTGRRNLKMLLLMHKLLSPERYSTEFRNGVAWKWVLGAWPLRWSLNLLNHLLHSKCVRLINKVFKSNEDLIIRRMSDVERDYVLSMMGSFSNNNDILVSFFTHRKQVLPAYLLDSSIEPSVAKRAIVDHRVIIDGVQIGLYNWPELICEKNSYSSFPNSVGIIKSHVNIPCWTERISLG